MTLVGVVSGMVTSVPSAVWARVTPRLIDRAPLPFGPLDVVPDVEFRVDHGHQAADEPTDDRLAGDPDRERPGGEDQRGTGDEPAVAGRTHPDEQPDVPRDGRGVPVPSPDPTGDDRDGGVATGEVDDREPDEEPADPDDVGPERHEVAGPAGDAVCATSAVCDATPAGRPRDTKVRGHTGSEGSTDRELLLPPLRRYLSRPIRKDNNVDIFRTTLLCERGQHLDAGGTARTGRPVRRRSRLYWSQWGSS